MFAWWGRAVFRWRWGVLLGAFALLVAGGTWGAGVFTELTGGGFEDRSSQSWATHEKITETFGSSGADLIVLYTADGGIKAHEADIAATLAAVKNRPEVADVTWDPAIPQLTSADGRSTYAAIQLGAADLDEKVTQYGEIADLLVAPGVSTQVGGQIGFQKAANTQTTEDITMAEILSMPLLLILLIFIFRGVVAALMPLIVGILAVLGAFVGVRALTGLTDVSVFAINIITLIGLGMAIDYSLFIVSRFREELAAGLDTAAAIKRTMSTAGRTVLVSGLTILLALASLLVFPQIFLQSMGYGGMLAVGVAMLAALTALPALLAVLGQRVNAWRVPLPVFFKSKERAEGEERGFWWGIAHSVMRRPVIYAVAVVGVLLALASPVVRMEFGGFDERVMPPGSTVREVTDRLASGFPGGTATYPIQIVVTGTTPEVAASFATTVAGVDGVTGAAVTGVKDGTALISASYAGAPTDAASRDTVEAIRALPAPTGSEQVLVGGRSALDVDLLSSLTDRLPWLALIMASATFVLLFLAFGSIVLPIKAVLMNMISIGASFGVIVWGFQEGHLADLLGFTSTGFIEPTNPILMLAVLFGLATDYEVFLLSRVREEWDATGDNTTAVARGLQRTGGIITAAALLLVIVVAGFATGEMAFIKLLGVGMIVAIIVDATLVRALLVPATMRLLGRWNWWAPGPLGKVYRRYGIREDDAAPAPAVEPAPAAV
ncbi:RND superfamily putative drug exporter [Allocatelliglobosispora scoriae]|uniref:RND superfamily putative drug exporter n=1 Tax=Allocatelliglobosispora scoriae TaxID=643052 RepID=A0A841BVQ6_9ACTN|nr:MMPL family transporter [Allocatelliglobosispora scoriae]MBB5872254.1 RND superfamily putative drug exporter [Allocatelliglobosispora scoriae]